MSTSKPKKPRSSTKATKADLEAKIAELESKLNALAAQASKPVSVSKPAETRSTPPPAPKPTPKPAPASEQHVTLPAGYKTPDTAKAEPSSQQQATVSEEEMAPAYSTTSSSGYTGNRYYATRQRLAYHPPDKQFRGGSTTVQVSSSPPTVQTPEPEPEPQASKIEEPKRIAEPPTITIKYTGDNYYKTRQRLAYHPPDKQFKETVAIKFEEAPTVSQIEQTTTSSQSKTTQEKKSRAQLLAEYEKDYLERIEQQQKEYSERIEQQQKSEATKSRGTMPAGWKPS